LSGPTTSPSDSLATHQHIGERVRPTSLRDALPRPRYPGATTGLTGHRQGKSLGSVETVAVHLARFFDQLTVRRKSSILSFSPPLLSNAGRRPTRPPQPGEIGFIPSLGSFRPWAGLYRGEIPLPGTSVRTSAVAAAMFGRVVRYALFPAGREGRRPAQGGNTPVSMPW